MPNSLMRVAVSFCIFCSLSWAPLAVAQSEGLDVSILNTALQKQRQIEGRVIGDVEYDSMAWRTKFVARLNADMEWSILEPDNASDKHSAAFMRRIEEDGLSNFSGAPSQADVSNYEDLKFQDIGGLTEFDFFTPTTLGNTGTETTDGVRLSIRVDKKTGLITQMRLYNVRDLRGGVGIKVKNLEVITDFRPLDGADAAVVSRVSSLVSGRAYVVTGWSNDYTATYSNHTLLEASTVSSLP